jgi:hypothetical protein
LAIPTFPLIAVTVTSSSWSLGMLFGRHGIPIHF